jgi:hypothetical protein
LSKFGPVAEYWLDAWRRSILVLDVKVEGPIKPEALSVNAAAAPEKADPTHA